MPATANERIRDIERDREQIHTQFAADFKTISSELEVPQAGLIVQALYLQHRLAGLTYRKEADDLTLAKRELLRPPFGILRKGGDCDDLNIVLAGGILRTIRGSTHGLRSLYLPDGRHPRHVVLLVTEHDLGYCIDLVPPRKHGPWIGNGFPVEW